MSVASLVSAQAAALLANQGQTQQARVYDRSPLPAGRIRPKVDGTGRILGNISDGVRPGESLGHYVCTGENGRTYMTDPTDLLAAARFSNTLQLQGPALQKAKLSVIHGVLMKTGFLPSSARWSDITDTRAEALADSAQSVVDAGY